MSKEEKNESSIKILAIVCLGILTSLNLLFILFFIGVSRVDASVLTTQFEIGSDNMGNWADNNLIPISRGYFRGCTSTTSCLDTTNGSSNPNGFLLNVSNTANDSKGLMFYVVGINQAIRNNTIYSIRALYCSDSVGTPSLETWTGNGYSSMSDITKSTISYSTWKDSNIGVYYPGTNKTYECYDMYNVMKTNQAGSVLGFHITSSSTTNSTKHILVGYNITELSPLDYVTVSAFNSGVTSINNNTNTKIASVITEIQNTKTAILNQMNANTESTNNAINEASENEIASQQVCTTTRIDKNTIKESNKYINQNGGADDAGNEDIGITDYIEINQNSIIKLTKLGSLGNAWACIYDQNYLKVECYSQLNLSVGDTLTIPNNAKYIRFTLIKSSDSPNWEIKTCKNGNQAMYDQNNEDNWQQEDPDKSGQDDLEEEESILDTYLANDSDLDALTIDVEPNDNIFIWDIFDRIITGNTILYSTFITILVFGVIKTILAR